MRVAALLVLLALPASAVAQKYGGASREAALAPIEKQMAAAVRQAWPKADVAVDAALTLAAEDLARSIAAGMALADAARPETVRLALARAGAVAPEIAPLLVKASTSKLALQRLRERMGAEKTPDQVGLGAVERGEMVHLVVLQAPKKVALDPFPAKVAVGARHPLAGKVLAPLRRATLYVTPPGGTPGKLRAGTNGPRVSAQVAFDKPGRWTLEVLADGPRGPEVAAILDVWAGAPIPATPAAVTKAAPEPARIAEKEALAAQLVNDLRRSRGLPAVRVDPKLTKIARDYAEELVRTGQFAHTSKISGTLADRLTRGGYPYAGAGENLAQAATVRQAHDSTVHSPGHLANLLGAEWTEAGFGVAQGTTPGGTPTLVLVEVFAAPKP